jgi:Protein of unknown function (DUF2892)
MSQNLGNPDRIARVLAAIAMVGTSVIVPLPLVGQIGLALTGVYMLGTSLVGTCLGYKLMGVSTCPVKQQRASL